MNKQPAFNLQLIVKRIIDFSIASLILIVCCPIYLVIAVLIKLDSAGPVFYRHLRVGKDGRTFYLYKFRTMVTGGDDGAYMNYLRELIESAKSDPSGGMPYRKMKDDSRVTRMGHFLRNYYLDELPQMLNILKGELSLVGPRPHVQFEVDNYTPEQRRRLTVTPGATGLWQVAGKADCTFNDLLAYDLEYIDNWCLLLDLRIIYTTVAIMFGGGEGFWTRINKRVPKDQHLSKRLRPAFDDKGDVGDIQLRSGKRSGKNLMSSISRHIPFYNRRKFEEISSIEE